MSLKGVGYISLFVVVVCLTKFFFLSSSIDDARAPVRHRDVRVDFGVELFLPHSLLDEFPDLRHPAGSAYHYDLVDVGG